MKVMITLAGILAIYVLWQYLELKKFETTEYEIHSDKIKDEIRLIMISDLHSQVYGSNNDVLFTAVKEKKPDLILIPGDMIVSKKVATYEVAYQAFRELSKIAPVYFSNGNHESKPARRKISCSGAFLAYEKEVKDLGIHILNNASEAVEVRGNQIYVSGVEINLECYTKGKKVPLAEDFLIKNLGEPKSCYHILLAHNPAYSRQYAEWGADLTLCGHNHGGLVRIPGLGSLISPQFQLFPKYDAGRFSFGRKEVIISRGLGTHTFHIRIFNRAELVYIRLLPEEKDGTEC